MNASTIDLVIRHDSNGTYLPHLQTSKLTLVCWALDVAKILWKHINLKVNQNFSLDLSSHLQMPFNPMFQGGYKQLVVALPSHLPSNVVGDVYKMLC
jgi:hypothetical protein